MELLFGKWKETVLITVWSVYIYIKKIKMPVYNSDYFGHFKGMSMYTGKMVVLLMFFGNFIECHDTLYLCFTCSQK